MMITNPEDIVCHSTLEDVATYIMLGLAPGGLVKRILTGERNLDALMPFCHELARPHLPATMRVIDAYTARLFENLDDLRSWRGFCDPESDEFIKTMLRVMLADRVWFFFLSDAGKATYRRSEQSA